jgi:hypothetical protein
MGVAAYALTAYRPEERGPLQGALNFAITNSVGAYLSLSGIAVIYGASGALNMAQIGVWAARHPQSRLVVVAFLLILAGLLVKAAVVPFHFWLADAHAVAPTPVCVLFSGVMVELGLYGIARVYWSMFGSALAHPAGLSRLLIAAGVLTAIVGAVYLPPVATFLGEGWNDAALPSWAVIVLLCCVTLCAGRRPREPSGGTLRGGTRRCRGDGRGDRAGHDRRGGGHRAPGVDVQRV